MTNKNDIELNDDGKTAYCDGCKKNEQLAGPEEIDSWTTGILYHATRENPAEYGQFCPDCSQEPEYEPEEEERCYHREPMDYRNDMD